MFSLFAEEFASTKIKLTMNSCICQESEILPEEEHSEFEKLVQLETLEDGGRTILYGVGGDPKGTPVLFFVPLGGNRKMILAIHEHLVEHSLKAICVNRPGAQGASPSNSVQDHIEKTCSDIVAVLNALQIDRVGLLCMCAGTSFAMAFCTRHPDRVTTGKVLVLAPWVLPADCPESTRLHRFAAHYLPTYPISHLVGLMESSMLNLFSRETIANQIRGKLSKEEKENYDERFSESSGRSFAKETDWVLGKVESQSLDVAVCLSTSTTLGIDYSKITGDVVIWQGDKDRMTSVPAAEWLAAQFPSATLSIIPNATHGGALFLLCSQMIGSLAVLK
jgi:pimeloyl-ACP methyl ester carboxylesterase